MATAHQAGISYLTFGELWKVISDEQTFPLFEPYLPPRDNIVVRMEEVRAIRNRVAHFREPHEQDEARFRLLLNDIQLGVRRFCARYNQECYLREDQADELTDLLTSRWESCGYGVELRGPKGWLYAPGHSRRDPLAHAALKVHAHPQSKIGNVAGLLYRISLWPRNGTALDVQSFLEVATRLHPSVVHILVESSYRVSVVLPAIEAAEALADVAADFLELARQNIIPFERKPPTPHEWPEIILWPNHPLNVFMGENDDAVLDLSAPDDINRS